jgi:hypothetical protein
VEDLSQKKLRRPTFDLVANRLLRGEHALRHRANRAVVEIRDRGIERPLGAHGVTERHSRILQDTPSFPHSRDRGIVTGNRRWHRAPRRVHHSSVH